MRHSIVSLTLLQAVLVVQFVSAAGFLSSHVSVPLHQTSAARGFGSTSSVDWTPITTATTANEKESDAQSAIPHLVFPGGGIFFYWQAGAVTYLREQGYNVAAATTAGASAGALTATLTATGVDFYKATELALDMADKAGVWDRSGGLQGVWGPMISDWLDELLPINAVELVPDGRLSLLVTPVPQFGKTKVDEFKDRKDLIRCNMASIHLPWFLDGKLTTQFRDKPCIDGSFLSKDQDYLPERNGSNVLVLDYNQDPRYESTKLLDFVTALSPDSIFQLLEDGKRYACQLEEQGKFVSLPKMH
jgi:hypothetical protein